MTNEPTGIIAKEVANPYQKEAAIAPSIAESGGHTDTQNNTQYQKHDCFDWVNLIILVLTFFAAGGAAFEAKRLADGTDRLIRDANDTAERQLRAYVWVTVGPNPIKTEKGHFQLVMLAQNGGQTPAYDLQYASGTVVAGFPLDVILPEPGWFGPRTVINPKGGTTILGDMRQEFTADEAALRNGTKRVYVYGAVIYKGAFNKPHKTTFRFMTVAGPVFTAPGGGPMNGVEAADEGNEAD